MAFMSVLVTGASGHVGANLVRALLAQGRRVRVLVHRDRRAVDGLDVDQVEGDVGDPLSLQRALAGADVVFHAAAHVSIRADEGHACQAVNVAGTRNMVNACLQRPGLRLVHFCSVDAIAPQAGQQLLDEGSPLVDAHGSPYACSKAASEREVRRGIAAGLDAVILFPTAVVGPYDFRPSHQGRALLDLAYGRLPALVAGGFDWVDARDVALAALRAAECAPKGAGYLLGGEWLSVAAVAALVEEFTGRPAPRLICPLWLARLAAPVAEALASWQGTQPLFTRASLDALGWNLVASHEKASRELGYRPRPFRETLADTLRWFQETGYLALRAVAHA
jgi:dihydroflavonol-4-reductase